MSKYIKYLSIALVLLAVIFGLNSNVEAKENKKAKDSDVTVAIVDGQKIKKSEILNVLKGQNIPPNVPMEALYPQIIDTMINDILLEKKVKKAKLDNDPEVLKRLKIAKKQIINAVFLEREIDKMVTANKIKAKYDELVKKHKGEKITHARHILVKTEKEAKDIIAELDKGANFAELAKTKSTGPTAGNGGDLGYFSKGEMLPEFSKVAFEMKVGTYSKKPVKTQFGWHVIKVEDRKDMVPPPFETIKPSLISQLRQEAIGEYAKKLRKEAKIERFDMNGKPLK